MLKTRHRAFVQTSALSVAVVCPIPVYESKAQTLGPVQGARNSSCMLTEDDSRMFPGAYQQLCKESERCKHFALKQ